MSRIHEFATSSNGDRWFLDRDKERGELSVVHRGNEPSGGHETRTSVPAFLKQSPRSPECCALVALLSADDDNIGEAQDSRTSSSL